MSPTFFALAFTVALLVITAYFIMGGLPLLILQHDTPLDSRFVRRFFEVYYTGAVVAATGAGLSFGAWGRWAFAAGAVAVVLVVLGLRRVIITSMARLESRIVDSEPGAIAAFRRVHSAALLVNLLQLVGLVWGLTQLTL